MRKIPDESFTHSDVVTDPCMATLGELLAGSLMDTFPLSVSPSGVTVTSSNDAPETFPVPKLPNDVPLTLDAPDCNCCIASSMLPFKTPAIAIPTGPASISTSVQY